MKESVSTSSDSCMDTKRFCYGLQSKFDFTLHKVLLFSRMENNMIYRLNDRIKNNENFRS